ncbi:MAG: hypothetical protein DMG13_13840 [Acidobacteria bacterium]|nr:MAG: hypothetical protein DMG13_13840 [Acidobacteriota bacterium]
MKNPIMVSKWIARCLILVAGLSFLAAAQSSLPSYQGPEVEKFLSEAKITKMQDIPVGVTRPRKATLELDGITHFAAFKTIDEKKSGVTQLDRGVEIEFQDSWRTEVAAYELDKLIGLGMVPATIQRTYDGKQGSMQFWLDYESAGIKMDEKTRITKKLSPPNPINWNQQVAKVRLWDNLIYNTDRNLGNLLITEDWKIRLIDHSRTFRPFNQLKDPKALTTFSRTLLAKLEELTEPMLREHLGKHLTPYQIQGLLKRRDVILELSKKLVKEKGAGAVLYQ